MRTRFTTGGYTLEITDEGYLTDPNGHGSVQSRGRLVGIQVIDHPLAESEQDKSILQCFLKAPDARLIAHALLSAAAAVGEGPF